MIGVTARYFAAFREQAGVDTEVLATRAATVAELFAEAAARHGFRRSRGAVQGGGQRRACRLGPRLGRG